MDSHVDQEGFFQEQLLYVSCSGEKWFSQNLWKILKCVFNLRFGNFQLRLKYKVLCSAMHPLPPLPNFTTKRHFSAQVSRKGQNICISHGWRALIFHQEAV